MRRIPDRRSDDGFTLVEMLTVIVIIGILAAIALPAFLGQKSKAMRAALKSDLRNVSSAQEAHFVDTGLYSATESALAAQGFRRSDKVGGLDITVYVADGAAAYCVRAEHEASGDEGWFASTAGAMSEVNPDPANCPG